VYPIARVATTVRCIVQLRHYHVNLLVAGMIYPITFSQKRQKRAISNVANSCLKSQKSSETNRGMVHTL